MTKKSFAQQMRDLKNAPNKEVKGYTTLELEVSGVKKKIRSAVKRGEDRIYLHMPSNELRSAIGDLGLYYAESNINGSVMAYKITWNE